jgi:flagellar hook-length control protein FliK
VRDDSAVTLETPGGQADIEHTANKALPETSDALDVAAEAPTVARETLEAQNPPAIAQDAAQESPPQAVAQEVQHAAALSVANTSLLTQGEIVAITIADMPATSSEPPVDVATNSIQLPTGQSQTAVTSRSGESKQLTVQPLAEPVQLSPTPAQIETAIKVADIAAESRRAAVGANVQEALTDRVQPSSVVIRPVQSETLSPVQAQVATLPTPPRTQSSIKANAAIEVKSAESAVAKTSESTPAIARAAQVEAALRMESAMSAMAKSLATDAGAQNTSDPAVTTIAAPKLADTGAPPPSLAQHSMLWMSSPDEEFSQQMTRGLATMLNQRGGVMTMRLNPPELGEVRVQMTLSRGVVSAEFQASTTQAHALLDRSLTALRSALEGQGLTVDRLNVHVASPGATGQQTWRDEHNGSWNQQGGSGSDRQSHDAANGESRGRHEHPNEQAQHWNRHVEFADLFSDLETHFSTLDTRNLS